MTDESMRPLILVVDDTPDNIDLLAGILRPAYKVRAARGGEKALVIGGGIAKAKGFLFRPLARFLSRYEWRPGGHKVRIVPAALDDRAGAFGAAWNALNEAQAL